MLNEQLEGDNIKLNIKNMKEGPVFGVQGISDFLGGALEYLLGGSATGSYDLLPTCNNVKAT